MSDHTASMPYSGVGGYCGLHHRHLPCPVCSSGVVPISQTFPPNAPAPFSPLAASEDLLWAQYCKAGFHAWMPWLPIVTDEGVLTMYVTYCVRCRHPEQYDMPTAGFGREGP